MQGKRAGAGLSWIAGCLLSVLLAGWTGEASAATLQGVQVVGGDVTQVVLNLDSDAVETAVSAFTMSDPDRLVIDVTGVKLDAALTQAAGDGLLIDHAEVVEMSSGPDDLVTRVTLFLKAPVEHVVRVSGSQVYVQVSAAGAPAEDPLAQALETTGTASTDQGTITVSSATPRQLSGPAAVAPQVALSSLDFQNLPDVSRVVIGIKGSEDFTAAQPQANLIVIDVPTAFLPQSLGRVLDTSQFISPVRMVRAYRTGRGTRVAISLRENSGYRAYMGGPGLLFVDVEVPESMKSERSTASQTWSAVSPGGSSSGISNATSSEILIGSDGRTTNPQASFQTGGGASDPSAMMGFAAGMSYDSRSASSPYSGQRISLDFVNADIHSIFRLISHVSRLNIVSGDDVKGSITVRMVDVPWDQALAAILQAKGLGSQRFGNIVRVAPIDTIKSEQQSALEAKRAKDELTELQLLVLPLNYVQAAELSEQIKALLTTRGSVQVDNTSNQIIVKETEQHLAQIRELVRHLDRQTPQVLIEARVVEANSNFTRSLGIQWGTSFDVSSSTGYGTGLLFPNSIQAGGGVATANQSGFIGGDLGDRNLMVDLGASGAESGIAMHLGSLPGLVDLDARLSAMEADGWGKVVSAPRVTTLDNQSAKVRQGQKIPFLSTSAGGTNVQFITAALQLEVTPHITSDGKVFLKVKVENNRADFSQLVAGQPAIQIKEAETELLVADGDTTVVGGVFATTESQSQHRTPGLSKIPLLGYLFKNSTHEITRNELLVFITPHIITKANAATSTSTN